jgi:hypothetical protein
VLGEISEKNCFPWNVQKAGYCLPSAKCPRNCLLYRGEWIGINRLTKSHRRWERIKHPGATKDQNGNGVLDIEDFKALHPVGSGKKSPAKVTFANFIKWFNTNGDGQISHQEFVNYYPKQNPSIPNDQYFEMLIRNAWNLPTKKA